jgi:hypothetical protein
MVLKAGFFPRNISPFRHQIIETWQEDDSISIRPRPGRSPGKWEVIGIECRSVEIYYSRANNFGWNRLFLRACRQIIINHMMIALIWGDPLIVIAKMAKQFKKPGSARRVSRLTMTR